jgi:hypothetical protein
MNLGTLGPTPALTDPCHHPPTRVEDANLRLVRAPKHASPHSSESVHSLQLCTPMHRPTLGPTSDSAPMLILPRSRSTSRGLEIALVF